VWVVINGRPLPVDTFAPTSTDSEQTLVVPTDLSGVTSAAITVEPAPGSQQPTGAIVMGGDL
jgi:anti-sigma-K factor RskA